MKVNKNKDMAKTIYAIDFDGTVVTHEYPKVGKDVPGAVEVLKKIVEGGDKIILNTMRSGETLEDAKRWFEDRGIPLYGVNRNPTQFTWTKSPKVYAHVYIDDAALGCPITYDKELSDRAFVDWEMVKMFLGL